MKPGQNTKQWKQYRGKIHGYRGVSSAVSVESATRRPWIAYVAWPNRIGLRHGQSWGLRPRSYDKTGLRPAGLGLAALVLVLVSWSYTFDLASNTVVPDRRSVHDTMMLKCKKHLYFLRAISAETVSNVTGHHITF